jgi:hypothetical protein
MKETDHGHRSEQAATPSRRQVNRAASLAPRRSLLVMLPLSTHDRVVVSVAHFVVCAHREVRAIGPAGPSRVIGRAHCQHDASSVASSEREISRHRLSCSAHPPGHTQSHHKRDQQHTSQETHTRGAGETRHMNTTSGSRVQESVHGTVVPSSPP